MDILYTGIDMSNKDSWVFGFTGDGEIVLDDSLKTLDEADWKKQLEQLSKEYEIWVAYEMGPHYEWMQGLLEAYCKKVVVVNAGAFAAISQSVKKTDREDAIKLAEGVRRGDLPDVFVPPPQSRKDRRLVSFVHWHSRREGNAKTRLRSLLSTYRLSCPCSDIGSGKARAWFEREAWPRMDDQGKCLSEMLLEELTLLSKQRAALDKEVERRLAYYEGDAEVLQSVPGFGPLTVLALISMIVDIRRFERAEKLSGYFGTCGRIYQSGQVLRLGSMTKRGNKTVRWLLSQAVHHLHRADPRARKRYLRLKRRKPTGVALGAQVNWLVRIVYYLLKDKTAYRINRRATKRAA